MLRGYCRISTNESKQDISRQSKELKDYGVLEENIVYEFISGTKNKPKLIELINKCETGDVIVSTELSRISRSFKDFQNTIELIKDKKLKLSLLMNNINVDFTKYKLDAFTEFFLNIMMAFNNLEVEVTRERVKSGLENARSKGVVLGRPKLTKEDIPDKFYRNLDLYKRGEINKVDFAKIMGWSRPKLNRILALNENK